MKHIGLICPVVSGHLNPMTTLGRELKRRGYRVSLIALPDGQKKAEQAGLEFLPIGVSEFPVGTMAKDTARLGELQGEDALKYTVERFCAYNKAILDDASKVIRTHKVEGLVGDETLASVRSVADHCRVPFVTVSNALSFVPDPNVPSPLVDLPYDPTPEGRARNQQVNAETAQSLLPFGMLINSYRIRWAQLPIFALDATLSPLACIAQQPAGFDFPRTELPSQFHYTGPFHNETSGDPVAFPFERLDDRPLIYASLGTLQNKILDIFRTIATACEGMDAQLVLSLGRKDQPIPTDFPGDPIIVSYAPQLELLKRASLVITHAGLNTALESLAQGVPMVAIPIANDQPGVAARIAYTGTGEFVPLRELTVERLRTAIERVSTNPSYRERTQAFQKEIASFNAVERAADIALQALTTRKPVLR